MNTEQMEVIAREAGWYAIQLLAQKQMWGAGSKMGCLVDDKKVKVKTFKELHELGWCGKEAVVLDAEFAL